MDLKEHAIMELDYLHIEDKEKDAYIRKFVLEFMDEFCKQEHSGMSAQIVINTFRHKMKDKVFLDKKLEEVIPNYDEYDLVHILMKKLWELINTEEFVVYEIDEEWIKRVCTRLIDWKPITPLKGTPDEWYDEDEDDPIYVKCSHYQNKRYSAIFAEDKNGKNAYNSNGKVFVQNGAAFINRDSIVPVTFPYDVPDEREVVELEDFIKVEDAPTYYMKWEDIYNNIIIEEVTLGYKASTLDKSISNPKFWKAEYCVLRKYKNEDGKEEYISDEEYDDMPIYRVRMNARFKEYFRRELKRCTRKGSLLKSLKVYEDKEYTKEVVI